MLKTLGSFRCERFEFEGQEAIVVFPDAEPNGSWVLKTEYWGAFPDVETSLLQKGFHVAFVKNYTRFATTEECALKARFVKFVSQKYNLSSKCVPVGMSCGGAHAVRFAGLYPDLVSCIYIDAPVLNYCSYPGKIGNEECEQVWENEFVKAYPGVKRYQLVNFDCQPLNMTDRIIESGIPVIMVYGTADKSVIYEENGLLFEQAFEGTDLLTAVRVENREHHPHGIIGGNGPIVEFIVKNQT